jgi:hypothetical protein
VLSVAYVVLLVLAFALMAAGAGYLAYRLYRHQ